MERIIFLYEANKGRRIQIALVGDLDDDMLQAIESFIWRKRALLGPLPTEPPSPTPKPESPF